ncbi:hypothetical protein ES708_23022 [subsurface metagenome]
MGWLDLAGQIVSKMPIERMLFPPTDEVKRLEDFGERNGYLKKSGPEAYKVKELTDDDIRDRIKLIYELLGWAGDDPGRLKRISIAIESLPEDIKTMIKSALSTPKTKAPSKYIGVLG